MPENDSAREPGKTLAAKAYRVTFALAVVLYLVCFLLGIGYVLSTRGRLPAINSSALSQAQEYLAKGDVQRAVQQYRMMSRIDGGNYETPKRIAQLLREAGDPSGEIDQFLRARQLWPRDPATHRSLAWAYYKNRRFAEALACFGDALALDPGDPEARRGIGEVWLEQDRYPEAIAAFAEAVRLEPRSAWAHNSLGIAYALSGAPAEGLRHFEQAARLDPRPDILANLARARAAAGAPHP